MGTPLKLIFLALVCVMHNDVKYGPGQSGGPVLALTEAEAEPLLAVGAIKLQNEDDAAALVQTDVAAVVQTDVTAAQADALAGLDAVLVAKAAAQAELDALLATTAQAKAGAEAAAKGVAATPAKKK